MDLLATEELAMWKGDMVFILEKIKVIVVQP